MQSESYDPRAELFVGSARVEDDTAGAGRTLMAAIENAYQNARRDDPSGRRNYQVLQIIVSGDNPISEYTIVLQKVGA